MAPNVESVIVQPKDAFERFFSVDGVATLVMLWELVRVVASVPELDVLTVMVPSVKLVNFLDGVDDHAGRILHVF